MMDLTIGHYRIVRQLGSGGMGEVYLAEDTRLHRRIALKVLPPALAARPDRLERFEREAQTLAALDHPNIVTIHSVEEAGGLRFLTMALVEGETLDRLIPPGGLPFDRFLELALPLTEGLRAAHERGIVHRDLKPANVMVDRTGRLRILDFGLARLQPAGIAGDGLTTAGHTHTPTASPAVTQEGAILGTYPYMSPEQVEGTPADSRSDIFSLGAVLYEMAAGERAFHGETPASLISSILKDTPKALRDARPDLPPALVDIVGRCLAKQPDERYPTAAAVRHALEEVRLHASSGVPAFRKRRGGWTRPGIVGAAALAIVSAVAVLPVWLSRWWPSAEATRIESLAVLPLRNLSGDSGQEYFVDGMTNALTTDLSKVRALRIISSTSSMRYKGSDKTLPEIASELGVDAVVEGSVIREGNSVRITAQLVDAETDQHLWADSFEREIRSVLALQGEIARAIAREIHVTLTAEEATLLSEAREVHPQAYEAYLRGTFHLNKLTADGVEQGLRYLQEAVEMDPSSPLALAGLALGYSLVASHSPDNAPPDAFRRAQAAYAKALELDEHLAEAHAAVAEAKLYREWDWDGAETAFLRALQLNPNLPRTRAHYAWYLNLIGRNNEAAAEMRRAQELDPLNPLWPAWVADLASYLLAFETGVSAAREALELDPDFPWALYSLGRAHTGLGAYDEAIAAHSRAVEIDPAWKWALAVTYAEAGRFEAARAIAAELEERSHPPDTLFVALIHLALGDRDRTVRWMEAAVEARHPFAPWLFRDYEELDLVRDDPRYLDLWKRMGLPLPERSQVAAGVS